jgi:hypothetical protein
VTAAVCAGCLAPVIPVLSECFDCGLRVAPMEPRATRRYRILPGGDRARLIAGLSLLNPEAAADDLRWVVQRSAFELVAEVTPVQEAGIAALARACGAPLMPLADPSARAHGVRFAWDQGIPAKMGASAAVGVATLWLGVPLVPLASCVMLAVLAARAARWASCEVAVARLRGDALLGAVDGQFIADLRTARARMTEPEVVEIVRPLVGHVAELSEKLRQEANHLLVPACSKADAALSDLARSALRLAVAANRAGPNSDPPEDPSGRRYSRTIRRFEDAIRRLRRIEAELAETREAVVAARPADLQNGALDRPLQRFLELKGECASALGDLGA